MGYEMMQNGVDPFIYRNDFQPGTSQNPRRFSPRRGGLRQQTMDAERLSPSSSMGSSPDLGASTSNGVGTKPKKSTSTSSGLRTLGRIFGGSQRKKSQEQR